MRILPPAFVGTKTAATGVLSWSDPLPEIPRSAPYCHTMAPVPSSTISTRLSGQPAGFEAGHVDSRPGGAPDPEIRVRPFGSRSASLGATTDVGPGTLLPSPNDHTMSPARVNSITRLLTWSAMRTLPDTLVEEAVQPDTAELP